MKSLVTSAEIDLANEIGKFIEYWGFKKIHGKVWCLIFLSKKPVDANFLIQSLAVSKALISITIKDLISYKVIFEAPKVGPTVCYVPNLQLQDVIFDVLKNREAIMLDKLKQSIGNLSVARKSNLVSNIDDKQLERMDEMIRTANTALKSILSFRDMDLMALFKTFDFG